MRTVAQYSFHATCSDQLAAQDHALRLSVVLHKWIQSKGEVTIVEGTTTVALRDGREAVLEYSTASIESGAAMRAVLTEPAVVGDFVTDIEIAYVCGEIEVSCVLRLTLGNYAVVPVRYDARCPRIVREILSYDLDWHYETQPLSFEVAGYRDRSGGADLGIDIFSKERLLPLICVSMLDGFPFHPGFAVRMASDVAGLGRVALVDEAASWELTNRNGQHWSCFNGAIRLYWPGCSRFDDPMRHPLWTPRRLLDRAADSEEAGDRLRFQLRRTILGVSAFTVPARSVIPELRRRIEERNFSRAVEEAKDTNEYDAVVELYEDENRRQRLEIDAKDEIILDLQRQLTNVVSSLAWRPDAEDEVPAESEAAPETVEEAVRRARERFGSVLVFGDDVEDGVASIRPEAGPPEKIYSYLAALAALAEAMQEGGLRKNLIEWLGARNVDASGEAEHVRNSADLRKARTWSDGVGQRYFDTHLKPNQATAPDKCVRIYFDWDSELELIVIGWIGRHPRI